MTVANVNVTKVLLKRGNTAQNNNYTGVNGELTIDTQAATLRIHDGTTTGGTVINAGGVAGSYSNTNTAAYLASQSITSANIGGSQTFANANAASQTTEINSLRANITAANSAITSLQSNAAVQAALLDTLTGNAATQSQVLDTLTSNAATQATTLTTLLSNAVAQQTSLIDLVANAAAQAEAIANVSGTYGNSNVSSYLSTFTGNVAAGNVITNNFLYANGLPYVNSGVQASYYRGYRPTQQGSITVGTAVAFYGTETSVSNDIALDVNNGNITLQPNRTYRIRGTIGSIASLPSGTTVGYQWYNASVGQYLGNSSVIVSDESNASYALAGGTAETIFTPSTTTNVQLRVSSITGGGVSFLGVPNIGSPWFDIEVIGGYSPLTITYSNVDVKSYLSTFDGNILPSANVTYSLGDATHQWRDLWVSNATIYMNSVPISLTAGNVLTVNGTDVVTTSNGVSSIGNLLIQGTSISIVPGAPNTGIEISPNGESWAYLQLPHDATANASDTRLHNDAGNIEFGTGQFSTGGPGYTWTLNNNGTMTFPGTPRIDTDANNFEVQAAEAINFEANTVVNIYTDTSGTTKQWQFGDSGDLSVPGDVQFADGSFITDNLEATGDFGISTAANVGFMVETNDGSHTWIFGTDGSTTFPDNTIFNGNTFTSPETNGTLKNFKWEFSDLSYGADTVTLQWNLLDTTFPQWYLTTNSQGNIYVFDGDAKTIGFLDNSINSGTVTFGTAANNGAGGTNDIELTTVTGNAYIRTSTNSWKFDVNGNLTIPGNINYANGVSILSGLGGAVTGNISVDTSAIQFVASSSGDGNGYSTIRMIPDTNLEGTDQYVIIDPTAPGHIHIRAGGTQDNSSADLILGGEESHVRVTAGSNPPVYIRANSASWMFGVDSSLSMPTGGNLYFDSSAVSVIDGMTSIRFADDTTQTTAWTGTVTFGNTIAIGYNTGTVSQGGGAVAIGSVAGNVSQGIGAVAVGEAAGTSSQGIESIAVGKTAGEQTQGAYSIAIGSATAYYQQGTGAVAIGTSAGALQQGDHAIAIGTGAGNALQGNNSIILNATGSMLDQTTDNTFTVAPIRNTSGTDGVLQYNNSTKEVSYSSTLVGNLSVTGNITQQSAYYETYANVINSGGNLTCNFVNGATFYATLTANVTVNFANVVATAGQATGATIIVDQGATPYSVANIQINGGGVQTVKWAGGTTNTGTASNTDIMSFSLISLDGTNWRILGQIANYA